MAVQIVSGASSALLTVDATSKAARVTRYDALGNCAEDIVSLANTLNTLNAAVTLTLAGHATLCIDVGSTAGSITLTFEGLVNTNWFAINGTPVAGGAAVGSATNNGQWISNIAGYTSVRARVSAVSGGSMNVSLSASPAYSGIATR